MAIPYVPVTCVVHTQDGVEVSGARFTFLLTNTEVYQGFVVPRRFEGTTDESGAVVINVFPNELGTKESMYAVVGIDNQGRKFLDGRAVIPASACDLINVVDLAAYANFDLAMQAKLDAQASAEEAQAQANASAASAAASAASSAASGVSAAASAASEATATTQAGTATTQAGISTAQAVIATAQAVISTTKAAEAAASAIAAAQSGGHRNRLINGDFSQNVRALTSVADDTYCLDRWYILTETGNVTVAQLTDPESGAPFGIRLTQPDASAKRMGFAQIIESKDIRQYATRVMHLAARLRLSTGANIRYAVIEHTGTADVVTSDVVSNWASATFTPSNFFIAGLNILSTGTITPGAATWGDVSAWAALSAGVKNVIVFIWTESQVAQNVTLDCSRIQYEPGVIATNHEWRMNEMALCLPYAFGLYGSAAETKIVGVGTALSTTSAYIIVNPPAPMRATPSVSLVGSLALRGGSVTAVATIASGPSDCTGPLSLSVTATDLTAGNAYILRLAADAATRLVFSAEL